LINPLAVGVTFGGLLLDIIVPRPKPRVGVAPVGAPDRMRGRLEDRLAGPHEGYDRPLVAGGEIA